MTGWMEVIIGKSSCPGDAIHIGDTTIVPLVDVSFGIGAGSFSGEKKEKGMGGIGRLHSAARDQSGSTRLVNIRIRIR